MHRYEYENIVPTLFQVQNFPRPYINQSHRLMFTWRVDMSSKNIFRRSVNIFNSSATYVGARICVSFFGCCIEILAYRLSQHSKLYAFHLAEDVSEKEGSDKHAHVTSDSFAENDLHSEWFELVIMSFCLFFLCWPK